MKIENYSLLSLLVCSWLRWRYGGNVYALKPPIGYHKQYCPRPWWWVIKYLIKKQWWKFENYAFQIWGEPMRILWENEITW
jgi:hypothetical protein